MAKRIGSQIDLPEIVKNEKAKIVIGGRGPGTSREHSNHSLTVLALPLVLVAFGAPVSLDQT